MKTTSVRVVLCLLGLTIFSILGCRGDTNEPKESRADDLMLMEKLVGCGMLYL